jgi:hypothetical protein
MLPSLGLMIVIVGAALLLGFLATKVVEKRVRNTPLSAPVRAAVSAVVGGGTGLVVLMTPVWMWVGGDKYFDWKCAREAGVKINRTPLAIKTLIVRDDSAWRELERVRSDGRCQQECYALAHVVRSRLAPLFESRRIDVYLTGEQGSLAKLWLAEAHFPGCIAIEQMPKDGACVAAEFLPATSLGAPYHRLVETPFQRCYDGRHCWSSPDKDDWLGVRRVEHHITDSNGDVVARIVGFERGVPEFFWKTCPSERRAGGLPNALIKAVVAGS